MGGWLAQLGRSPAQQDQVAQSSYLQSLAAMDSEMATDAAQDDGGEDGHDDEDYGEDDPDGREGGGGPAQAADDGRAAALPIADPAYAQAVAAELQETVKYWSDFLKVHMHPRSLHTLERVNRCESFDCYAAGTEAFKTDRAIEEATDACRHFLEVRCTCTRARTRAHHNMVDPLPSPPTCLSFAYVCVATLRLLSG